MKLLQMKRGKSLQYDELGEALDDVEEEQHNLERMMRRKDPKITREGIRLKSEKYRALEQHRRDIIDALRRESSLRRDTQPIKSTSTPRYRGKPRPQDYEFWTIR